MITVFEAEAASTSELFEVEREIDRALVAMFADGRRETNFTMLHIPLKLMDSIITGYGTRGWDVWYGKHKPGEPPFLKFKPKACYGKE